MFSMSIVTRNNYPSVSTSTFILDSSRKALSGLNLCLHDPFPEIIRYHVCLSLTREREYEIYRLDGVLVLGLEVDQEYGRQGEDSGKHPGGIERIY